MAGNYTRTANFQRLQLWNDAVGTTEFDDARVSTTPPPGATLPGAPTGVSGSPRDQAVALTWTAPSSNGGSAISGYRITPFIGGVAQTPTVATDYPVTNYTVTGLTNGTAYTFRVAAINGVGAGLGLSGLGCGDTVVGNGAGHSDGRHGCAWGYDRDRGLDRAGVRRRSSDHRVPRHPVHRLDRPDTRHRRRCIDDLRR